MMSDASMRTQHDKSDVREGILIFRRSGPVVNAIGWSLRLTRSVTRSTGTAKLLADANVVEPVTFLKHLLKAIIGMQTTKLILHSCTAFH